MAFAVTGLAFVPGLFRYRLLDLTPVAWAAVVEGMDDPVLVIDPEGRIVELNPAAERVAGRKASEVLGTEAVQAFAGWPSLADRLGRIEEQGEAAFELEGPDATGSRGVRRADLAAGRPPSGRLGRRPARHQHAPPCRGGAAPDAPGAGGAGRGRGGEPGQGPVPGDPQPRAPHAPDTDPRHRRPRCSTSPRRPNPSAR